MALTRSLLTIIVSLYLYGLSAVHAHGALPVPQAPVQLQDSGEMWFVRFPGNTLSLEQARNDTALDWQLVDADTVFPNNSPDSFWIRVKLAPAERASALALSYLFPRQEVMDVYFFRNGQLDASYLTGTSRPFDTRPVANPSYIFPVDLSAGDTLEIYLHAQSLPRYLLTFLQLVPQDTLITRVTNTMAIDWFFMGLMAIVSMIFLLAWIVTRQLMTGLFSLYTLVQLVNHAVAKGFGFWLLWPDSPAVEQVAVYGVTSFLTAVVGAFSVAFLNVARFAPRLDKVFKAYIGFLLLCALGPALFPVYKASILYVALAALVPFYLALFGCGLWLWLRKNRWEARVFCIAWGLYIVATLTETIMYFFQTDMWYSTRIVTFAQLAQTILLGGGLGFQLRYLRQKEQLARAESKAKSEFLAVMSHEIRTPMNGMLGMAELLENTRLDEQQRYYTNTISNSGKTLLRVINDILDYSKVEAGKLELERAPFNLADLIESTVAPYRMGSVSDTVVLTAAVTPGTPIWLKGDAVRLQQVITNLLANAFKFTREGEVNLRIEAGRREAGRVELCCHVQDTGTGITPQAQERLFQSFSQADSSTTRNFGGTGLGLAICKRLVMMMDGDIGVSSIPGKGSTFSFNVWLSQATPQHQDKHDINLRNYRVLVVDDHRAYRNILMEQTNSLGMSVESVDNLPAARARLQEDASFDLLMLDWDMPDGDGISFARELREHGISAIPIVLVTASNRLPEKDVLQEAGIQQAAYKPTSREKLAQLFIKALGSRLSEKPAGLNVTNASTTTSGATIRSQASSGEHPDSTLASLNILVVEDNPVNQILIKAQMDVLGVSPTVVDNGSDAYNVIAEGQTFDLILMDCEMPHMDGFQTTRAIREFEQENGNTPMRIVALTAGALDETVDQCRAAGMNDHLAKPTSIEMLRTALNEVPRPGTIGNSAQ